MSSTAENSPNSSVFAIPCLFRLLYGTGIRINEALRLSCQDVNLMDKYLVLHDNKNGKDRMVPISNSLTIVCEEYLKHSQQYRTNYDSRRFFIKPNGKPFGSEAAYKWFRKLIYEAEYPIKVEVLGQDCMICDTLSVYIHLLQWRKTG